MDAGDAHGAMARAAIAGAPRWARDGAMARGGVVGWTCGGHLERGCAARPRRGRCVRGVKAYRMI